MMANQSARQGAKDSGTMTVEFFTWCQFKDAYLRKYYPITTKVKMQASFLELKQGDMSVEKYDLEFNRMARFSPAYVSTDELKVERYIAGLRDDLKGM